MPPSVFDNLWALNPWGAEPDRGAALAPSLRNVLTPVEPLVVPPPPPPPTKPRTELPDISYEADDWYQSLRRHWPTKAPVIPRELHVDHSMAARVCRFVGKPVAADGTPLVKPQCYDYAAYQLHRGGYRTGGRPSIDARSWQVLVEHQEGGRLVQEVQLAETLEAVLYIQEVLQDDVPVLVGVCIRKYAPRPNNVKSTPFTEPTNHFVVIVGMGKNDHGVYFDYYDYYFRPDGLEAESTRLYLKPTLKLEWLGGEVTLAEVRRSVAR